MGYELIDGNESIDEYYNGLGHKGTISEAREDYKQAKELA